MRSPDIPAEIADPNPPPIKPVVILMLSPMLSIEPGSEMTYGCRMERCCKNLIPYRPRKKIHRVKIGVGK